MNPLGPVLFVLAMQAQPAQQQRRPADHWFAEDKARHMLTSMAVTGFAHSGARLAGMKGNDALIASAAGAAALGILKEFHDKRAGKVFSFRDLTWDAVGIGLGLILVSNAR